MWLRIGIVNLLFLTVCVSVTLSESGSTGITGVIIAAPIRPGPIKKDSESPKQAPLPNATFSVTSDNGAVTRFTTDPNGRFRVSLEPGRYVVSLAENRFPKPCGPFEISVETGKMTNVEWRCDTGMR